MPRGLRIDNKYIMKLIMVTDGTANNQSIPYKIEDLGLIIGIEGDFVYNNIHYKVTLYATSTDVVVVKDIPELLNQGIEINIILTYLKDEEWRYE